MRSSSLSSATPSSRKAPRPSDIHCGRAGRAARRAGCACRLAPATARERRVGVGGGKPGGEGLETGRAARKERVAGRAQALRGPLQGPLPVPGELRRQADQALGQSCYLIFPAVQAAGERRGQGRLQPAEPLGRTLERPGRREPGEALLEGLQAVAGGRENPAVAQSAAIASRPRAGHSPLGRRAGAARCFAAACRPPDRRWIHHLVPTPTTTQRHRTRPWPPRGS